MQHFSNYKTLSKLEWLNIEIYEKLDGFRFGFIKKDSNLQFLKRNNKIIDEIDLTFFPYYYDVLNVIKNINIKNIIDNEVYGFEIFHPKLHNIDKLLIYQTQGPKLFNSLQDLIKNHDPSFIDTFDIIEYLKNNDVQNNYNCLVKLFNKNLIFKTNIEGFVLKIQTKNKNWICKIVNPKFTEKAKLNYQEKVNKESFFNQQEYDELIILCKNYKDLTCFEFANKIYPEFFIKKIIDKSFFLIKEDLFTISNNKKIENFLLLKFKQDENKETKQKIALYKAIVMFHQKFLKNES